MQMMRRDVPAAAHRTRATAAIAQIHLPPRDIQTHHVAPGLPKTPGRDTSPSSQPTRAASAEHTPRASATTCASRARPASAPRPARRCAPTSTARPLCSAQTSGRLARARPVVLCADVRTCRAPSEAYARAGRELLKPFAPGTAERRGDVRQRLEPQRERAPRQHRRARQSEPLASVLRFRRVAEPAPAVGAMKAPEQARQLQLVLGQRC
jgi:hypothetical protein